MGGSSPLRQTLRSQALQQDRSLAALDRSRSPYDQIPVAGPHDPALPPTRATGIDQRYMVREGL